MRKRDAEMRFIMTENIRKGIIEFVQAYCIATTATVFVCAVFNSIFFRGALLQHGILWQILLLCFVCSLCNFIPVRRQTGKEYCLISGCVIYILTLWFGAAVISFGGVA